MKGHMVRLKFFSLAATAHFAFLNSEPVLGQVCDPLGPGGILQGNLCAVENFVSASEPTPFLLVGFGFIALITWQWIQAREKMRGERFE